MEQLLVQMVGLDPIEQILIFISMEHLFHLFQCNWIYSNISSNGKPFPMVRQNRRKSFTFRGKKRERTEGRVGLAAREERKQMSAQWLIFFSVNPLLWQIRFSNAGLPLIGPSYNALSKGKTNDFFEFFVMGENKELIIISSWKPTISSWAQLGPVSPLRVV